MLYVLFCFHAEHKDHLFYSITGHCTVISPLDERASLRLWSTNTNIAHKNREINAHFLFVWQFLVWSTPESIGEARRPESKARPLEEILASSPHPTSFPLSETIAHALQTKEQRTVDIHSEAGKKRKPREGNCISIPPNQSKQGGKCILTYTARL